MKLETLLKAGALAVAFTAASISSAMAAAAANTAPIRVGILHSLSGTMAISETTLKDVMLMLIDEQNKRGGLLGRKLEAVVVDPASNWPLFAEKTRELLQVQHVDVDLLDRPPRQRRGRKALIGVSARSPAPSGRIGPCADRL